MKNIIEKMKKSVGDILDQLNGLDVVEKVESPAEGEPTMKVDLAPVVDIIGKVQDSIVEALTPIVEKLESMPEGTTEIIKFVSDNKDAIQKYVDNHEAIDSLIEKADEIGSIPEVVGRLEKLEEVRGIRMSDPSEPIGKSEDASWGDILG